MKKDRTCTYCDKLFLNTEGRVFSNHVRWCDKNLTNGDKGVNKNRLTALKFYENLNGKIKEFNVNCKQCKKDFLIKEPELQFPKKEKYFCSKFCSAQYSTNEYDGHSKETKEKISKLGKLAWKNGLMEKVINNPNHIKRFNSKGEIEIRNYFQNKFPENLWTSGGIIKFKNESLVRDMYSKKLKICIEYDGIWHFKDIHGQLKRKQFKDSLLEEWCLENDYKLIRIDEDLYLKDKQYWLNEIEKAINGDEKIVKFYAKEKLQ